MRKKVNLLAGVLFALMFSMLMAPAAAKASDQCARIDYLEKKEWVVYHLIEASAHPDEPEYLMPNDYLIGLDKDKKKCYEEIRTKRPLQGVQYSTEVPELSSHFVVVASKGAVVTYGSRENKMVETQPDLEKKGEDVYQFLVPSKMIRNGGKRYITAKLGDKETRLLVEYQKMTKISTKEKYVTKARLDMSDKSCTYGKILFSINGGDLTEYWIGVEGDTYKDITEKTTAADWNRYMKPLVREGATVYCGDNELHDLDSNEYWSTHEVTDTTWTISTVNIKEVVKYDWAKIKIPAQKQAPKVKVDVLKGTLSTNSKMEYCSKLLTDGDDKYGPWTAAAAKQKLSAVTSPAVSAVSGVSIRIRVAGTNKKIPSCYRTIRIPSRGSIDLSQIKIDGVSTDASITISDLDMTKKPYEYTMDTPGDSTKWKKIGKNGLKFKGKSALSDGKKIYIREKGVNENVKKGISLKVPSSIAELTVSGAAVSWTKEAYDMAKFDR